MADIYVATTGNDSTGTGSSGNPYATPGKGMSVLASDGRLWIKSGTYSIDLTKTVNTAGGPISLTLGESTTVALVTGYSTTIGDGGRAVLQITTGSAGVYAVTVAGNHSSCAFLEVDGQSIANTAAFNISGNYNARAFGCVARNVSGNGFTAPGNNTATGCTAVNCGIGFNTFLNVAKCFAISCTTGYSMQNNDGIMASDCFAYGCGTGFIIPSDPVMIQCHAESCTGDGFTLSAGARSPTFLNCVSYGNGGKGVSGTTANALFINCAFGSNTSGNYGTTPTETGTIALGGSPLVSPGGGNYALNNTAGAGALLRAAGWPATIAGLSSTGNYRDIGAVQHQDSGGGSVSTAPRILQPGTYHFIG